MKASMKTALLAPLLLLVQGCMMPKDTYMVDWMYSENLQRKLDAGWFLRDVMDKKGLAAIELMYCPMQPEKPVVCRTAVVWQRDARTLAEHPRLGPAPPPIAD